MISGSQKPRGDTGPPARKRVVAALVVLILVVLGGTFSFMIVEGWAFWDALFFTLVTVTTVGYGDNGISLGGERIASVLLIVGIGTATYAFGVIVQSAVSTQLAWRKKMERKIDKLAGHYIICGFGRIGRTICERLAKANVPFVIIEGNSESLEDAHDLKYMAVRGNATEDEVLIAAGIKRAEGIVCAVNSDSDNIVITLGARELRPDIRIFARVDEDGATRKIARAGATHVVSPFRTCAVGIASAITHPNLASVLGGKEMGENDFELSEVTVEDGALIDGGSLGELRSGHETALVFVAIRRADETVVVGPSDSEILHCGDVIIVAGAPREVELVCEHLSAPGTDGRQRMELTTWGPRSPVE